MAAQPVEIWCSEQDPGACHVAFELGGHSAWTDLAHRRIPHASQAAGSARRAVVTAPSLRRASEIKNKSSTERSLNQRKAEDVPAKPRPVFDPFKRIGISIATGGPLFRTSREGIQRLDWSNVPGTPMLQGSLPADCFPGDQIRGAKALKQKTRDQEWR